MFLKYHCTLLIFLALLFPLMGHAAPSIPVPIHADMKETPIGSAGSFVRTPEDVQVEDVLKPYWQQKFVQIDNEYANLGISDGVFWFKFSLRNIEKNNNKVMFELQDSLAYNIELYRLRDDGSAGLIASPDATWTISRPIKTSYFTVLLDLKAEQTSIYLMRLHKPGRILLASSVSSIEQYIEKTYIKVYGYSITQGIFLALALYHLFIFFGTREKLDLYFSLYLFVALFSQISGSGLVSIYFQMITEYSLSLHLGFLVLNDFFRIQFCRYLLSSFNIYPKIDSALITSLVVVSICFLYVAVVSSSSIEYVMLISSITANAVILFALIYALKSPTKSIVITLIAFLVYLIGASVILGLISANMVDPASIVYSIQLAQAIFVLTLSLAVSEKITELKRRSISAERAVYESEVKHKTQEDFFANLSHELRTPLNGILGVTELLQTTNLDDTQKHYSKILESSGSILLDTINDVLDYSKIKSNMLSIEEVPLELSKLLDDVRDMFAFSCADRGVDLVCSIDVDLPSYVLSDPVRLRQILINLVGNAVKFTRSGEIVVSVKCDGPDFIKFVVSDSGIGISEEGQQKIFNPFDQAEENTARKYGGTGLGLAICKRLVELMGGNIDVSSKPGKGSSFVFSIPMVVASPDEDFHVIDTGLLKNKSVLIVENNSTLLEIYSTYARHFGMNAEVSTNVDMAIKVLKVRSKTRGGTPFDLLYLDYRLGEFDCVDLIKYIDRSQDLNTMPSIIVTASGFPPDINELRKFGVKVCEAKPTSANGFIRLFQQALDVNFEKTEVVKQPRSTARHLNLLIAEDNVVNQTVISGMLNKLGHKVTMVEDGVEALAAFCQDEQSFDAILMDCEMPNMNGYDASRSIRKYEKDTNMQAIKIVALTAHVSEDRVKACLDAGMDIFLSKPIKLDQLKSELDKLFP